MDGRKPLIVRLGEAIEERIREGVSAESAQELVAVAATIVALHGPGGEAEQRCEECGEEYPCLTTLLIARVVLGGELGEYVDIDATRLLGLTMRLNEGKAAEANPWPHPWSSAARAYGAE
jgi:hypothetical protein